MTISNLTYQERARFAYADGNTELAEALERCAELQEALTNIVEDWQYAGCPALDGHIGIKHLKAAEEIL